MKIITASWLPLDAAARTRDLARITYGLKEISVDVTWLRALNRDGTNLPEATQVDDSDLWSPEWWAGQTADGVVVNNCKTYHKAAFLSAAKACGAPVMLRLDSGSSNPIQAPFKYFRSASAWFRERGDGRLAAEIKAAIKTMLYMTPFPFDLKQIAYLSQADLIAVETPTAWNNSARLFAGYKRHDLIRKLRFIPHPVGHEMRIIPGIERKAQIVAVGRWDAFIKGGPLLIKSLAAALNENGEYRAVIVGNGTDDLEIAVRDLPRSIRNRVSILGPVKHEHLATLYNESRILLNTSYSEGSPLVANEALCCGCSIVAPQRISAIRDWARLGGGDVSKLRTSRSIKQALLREMQLWDLHGRQPEDSSRRWQLLFNQRHVAERVRSAFANIS